MPERMGKGELNDMEDFILKAALEGLEQQKVTIEKQIAQVQAMRQKAILGPTLSKKVMSEAIEKDGVFALIPRPAKAAKPKRTMSAAGRAAVKAGQKKRWAAFRKAQKKGGK